MNPLPAHSESTLTVPEPPASARRARRRPWLWLAVALLGAWLLPNLVRLNYIQREIAAALAANLGREVRIGDVHPHLISGWQSGMGIGLGFAVENVEIADDPRFGIEPLAHIESVEARLAARSLWRARLEFSSVVLNNPSVNLVRSGSGEWNLLALPLAGANGPGAGGETAVLRPPDVRIVDGRLNFKLDGRKKSFHLRELFVELSSPGRSDQPWGIRFSGTPSRASFEQVPAIVVRGEGRIGPFPAGAMQQAGAPLMISWQARDALLGEIVALLAGREHGTHGMVSARGELTGTTTLMRVSGEASISDLHRWDVIPEAAAIRIPAEFSGVLDGRGDLFQLARLTLPLQMNGDSAGTLRISGSVEQLSRGPLNRLEARAENVSLAALRELGEPLAVKLDPAIQVEGRLNGHLELWGRPAEWKGEVTVEDLTIARSPEAGSGAAAGESLLRFEPVGVRLAEGKYQAGPVQARFGDGERLRLSVRGSLQDRTQEISLRGDALPLPQLLAWMPEAAPGTVALLGGAGAVNMTVRLDSSSVPRYRGTASVDNAVLQLRGLPAPLEITSARAQWNNRSLAVRSFTGRLGESELRGTARLTLPAADTQALAAEFAVEASELNLNPPAAPAPPEKPAWYAAWLNRKEEPTVEPAPVPPVSMLHATGSIRALRLRVGELEFGNVSAAARWDGMVLAVSRASASLAGGEVRGEASLQLGAAPLRLTSHWNFRRVDAGSLTEANAMWRDQFAGLISGDLRIGGAGAGWDALWRDLSGGGQLQAQDVKLHRWLRPAPSPGSAGRPLEFARLAASYEFSRQLVRITELTASAPAEPGQPAERRFAGSGSIGFDHAVDVRIEVSGAEDEPAMEQHWAGTLAEPLLEVLIPGSRSASMRTH